MIRSIQKFTRAALRTASEASLTGPAGISIPKRVERPNESDEQMRRRLVYQSRKRGILEADLLLSTFIDKYMSKLTTEQLRVYDRLLDENDWDLYYWTAGERPIPDDLKDNEILQMLKTHFKNEGKQILRMPNINHK